MKKLILIVSIILLTALPCRGGAVPPFTTIFMRTVLDDATAAAARTTLGLGTGDSPTWTGATITGGAVIGLNSAIFQPTTDSTTFFQVKDEDGNVIVAVDTTNNRIDATTFNATDEDGVLQVDGTCIFRTGTSTNYNVFLGDDVFTNDEGQYNVGIGTQAGKYNDITGAGDEGWYNTYIGYQAGLGDVGGNTGYMNFALGRGVLSGNSSGARNVGIGYETFSSNTMGFGNVGIGYFAMRYNKIGNYNVALGYQAGYGVLNNSFSENVLVGRGAGFGLTTGSSNVIIGYKSGHNQTTNSDKLIIDNQDRGSAALELTNSLIYGVFNASTASQSLRFNLANLYLADSVHSDADDAGAVAVSFIREDGAGTASTAATITGSHDGAGANDTDGKLVFATDDGSGLINGVIVARGGLSTPTDPNTLGNGDTTFICESNVMIITGDGGGNTIGTITGAKSGTLLTMIFVDGNVTITDTDAHTANTVDLAGTATDFTSADDKTLQIVYDGTSWYETSRSVN